MRHRSTAIFEDVLRLEGVGRREPKTDGCCWLVNSKHNCNCSLLVTSYRIARLRRIPKVARGKLFSQGPVRNPVRARRYRRARLPFLLVAAFRSQSLSRIQGVSNTGGFDLINASPCPGANSPAFPAGAMNRCSGGISAVLAAIIRRQWNPRTSEPSSF